MTSGAQRALVLGGGGVTGIAWELGYLAGLCEGGVDVTRADLLVGTSAGASVAVQITSGYSLHELWQRQLDALPTPAPATVEMSTLSAMMKRIGDHGQDPSVLRRQVGAIAAQAKVPFSPAERREMVAARLLAHAWPRAKLALVAVDIDSGEPRVFDRDSGVPLVDAVAASAALPGVYPPAAIDGHRYMDGALRSMENADLAAGYQRVIVLQPLAMPEVGTLDAQITTLVQQEARVHVARPDRDALAAIGDNILDPAACAATARAGHAQGRDAAGVVRRVWN